jgi:hypothetical protein
MAEMGCTYAHDASGHNSEIENYTKRPGHICYSPWRDLVKSSGVPFQWAALFPKERHPVRKRGQQSVILCGLGKKQLQSKPSSS